MKLKNIFIPILIITLTSCNDGKLTRSFAKNAMNEKKYPDTIKKTFSKSYCLRDCLMSMGSITINQLNNLSTAGLIKLDTEELVGNGWYKSYSTNLVLSPTKNGKQYTIDLSEEEFQIILYSTKVKEITGIIETDVPIKSAEVHYTLEIDQEFPPLKILNTSPPDLPKEMRAVFVKYDDGWRLKEN